MVYAIQDSLQKQVKALLSQGKMDIIDRPLKYVGVTTSDVATEIFLENQPNQRLEIPDNSVLYLQWAGVAFNLTTGLGTTHGNVFAGEGSLTARRATTAFALVGAAVGTGFIFTANDVLDALVCTVTGVAGQRIIWECTLTPYVSSSFAQDAASGLFDGIQ
jgi:hypothetical protein